MKAFHPEIAAIGIALLLALCAGYPKGRRLRFSLFDAWGVRKETAKSQLQDKAVQSLARLQAELNAALGLKTEIPDFNFTVDPTIFRPTILEAASFYETRQGIEVAYARARTAAKLVPRMMEGLALTGIWFFTRVSWDRDWPTWTRLGAIIPAALALLGLLAAYGLGQWAESRVERAVMTAEEKTT